MSNSMTGIFSNPLLGAAEQKQAKAWRAARGLGAVFAGMLASEMRKSLGIGDKGPMGIGTGNSDMYGAFFDQTMGQALAKSSAMVPLETAIKKSIMSQPARAKQGLKAQEVAANYVGGSLAETGTTGEAGGRSCASDRLGPVMLPPEAAAMAPVLPPPTASKGEAQ